MHLVDVSMASEGPDVACKCLGTHTGLMDLCGPTYRARETTDNVADEVSVGYRDMAIAMASFDGSAEAVDNGWGTFADA